MLAQQEGYNFRIIGLSGTCYRDKAQSIVGPDMLFKSKLCSISAGWLIEQKYLVRPEFGIPSNDHYDFSKIRVNNMGKFNNSEIQKIINENERLTGKIMRELQAIKCNGIFIFAATRKHCEECARSLPDGEWAIITGETSHAERKNILDMARNGTLHYLISVNCLNVGVDVPRFDVCAWLRPTESLVLYTQGIGRVLRLHPGKRRALVLDYAGNLERHGDIDDPIINEALKPNAETEKDYIIPCYTCGTSNTIHARRCIGVVGNKRCDHFFEFKACHACQGTNDITSRYCSTCDTELIDPNAKLKKITPVYELRVIQAEYWVNESAGYKNPIINAKYSTNGGDVFECYFTNSQKSKNILYAKFIRDHLVGIASKYYILMDSKEKMQDMIKEKVFRTPIKLRCTLDEYGRYHITKKLFHSIE